MSSLLLRNFFLAPHTFSNPHVICQFAYRAEQFAHGGDKQENGRQTAEAFAPYGRLIVAWGAATDASRLKFKGHDAVLGEEFLPICD